jgi:hypothetical protein
MGTVLCTVPCSRQQQGNWIPAAAPPAPDGASITAPNPQLVVVIDGFCGSSAKQTASTATQTGSVLGGSSSRSLRHTTSSGKGASSRSGVSSSAAGRMDSASSAAQQSVSPTQATPRASIMGRLLRKSSSGVKTPAASPTATSASVSSPQHRKVHRRLRRQPDAQADEPHSIGKRTGATQYEQLFLGFSLVSLPLNDCAMSAVLQHSSLWCCCHPDMLDTWSLCRKHICLRRAATSQTFVSSWSMPSRLTCTCRY